ncbi:MAG: hypothetical protein V5A62_18845 [Haloarculaceae archaeon]
MAKLALALVVLTLVLVSAVVALYRYFDKQAERAHEKDLQAMEHTERMVDVAESGGGIDAELEREGER